MKAYEISMLAARLVQLLIFGAFITMIVLAAGNTFWFPLLERLR